MNGAGPPSTTGWPQNMNRSSPRAASTRPRQRPPLDPCDQLLASLAVGDVVSTRRDADNLPGQIADWKRPQGDVDQVAVLADALRLKRRRNAGLNAVRDLFDLAASIVRNDELDERRTNRLRSRVAIEQFGAAVPGGDSSVEVLGEDPIR